MYPHERSLVQKLQGKPFALIGVNSDDKREFAKNATITENLTWRSFWNGPGGTSGPISSAWRVSSWPSIWVIDDRGVIRYRNVRGPEMEAAVEALLKEIGG
jgi:hypothetical protein